MNKYTLAYRFLNGNVHGCVFAKNRPVSLNWSDYRRDRAGDRHGGICVLVPSKLYAKRRVELELQNTVCILLELFVGHKKLLIGTFYRNTSSSNDALIAFQNVIGLASDKNIHDMHVLIT